MNDVREGTKDISLYPVFFYLNLSAHSSLFSGPIFIIFTINSSFPSAPRKGERTPYLKGARKNIEGWY